MRSSNSKKPTETSAKPAAKPIVIGRSPLPTKKEPTPQPAQGLKSFAKLPEKKITPRSSVINPAKGFEMPLGITAHKHVGIMPKYAPLPSPHAPKKAEEPKVAKAVRPSHDQPDVTRVKPTNPKQE